MMSLCEFIIIVVHFNRLMFQVPSTPYFIKLMSHVCWVEVMTLCILHFCYFVQFQRYIAFVIVALLIPTAVLHQVMSKSV